MPAFRLPLQAKSRTMPQPKSLLERLHQAFWLLFLVGSLGYAWYAFYAPSNDIAWNPDFEAAATASRAGQKPMLVFVTATWCSPCRIMKREVWADDEVKRWVEDRFFPVLLDADAPDAAPVLKRYGIQGTPCTLVINGEGEMLDYRFGAVSKPDFLEWTSRF